MLHAPFSVLHTHYLFLNMFKIILWHRYNDNPFFIEYTKVKKLSQGQTWKNQDSNPGSQGPKPSLFTITRMSRIHRSDLLLSVFPRNALRVSQSLFLLFPSSFMISVCGRQCPTTITIALPSVRILCPHHLAQLHKYHHASFFPLFCRFYFIQSLKIIHTASRDETFL